MKLLMAFIEAPGFEVETVIDKIPFKDGKITGYHEVCSYKVTKKPDSDIINAMDRAVELMYAEYGSVEPDIVAAFRKAGWDSDDN